MSLDELKEIIENEIGVLLYFSRENCNVCYALKPKFKELFNSSFPKIRQIYIDAEKNPLIAAHFRVFSVPTILVFLDGREFMREGRAVSLYQFKDKLLRPYNIIQNF